MANTRKRLGANALAAIDTFYDLYTCPASTQATIKVTAVNRGSSAATVRIAHRNTSGDPIDADYLEYDTSIDSHESITFAWTGCLGAGDRIVIKGSATDLTFIAEGMEHS
jgi:hypothetical protein